MLFQLFTLQPHLFDSFFQTSLIARGLSQHIFDVKTISWRDQYGVGNYKQVDDRPYGGSHGMVLQADPIFRALQDHHAVSELYEQPLSPTSHVRRAPNNSRFEKLVQERNSNEMPIGNVTILLTPQGYSYNQKIAEWIASNFETVSLVCGRYEGFDARVNDCVDLEISLGDYILNGGEVAAMAMIESIARLLPGFLTKEQTAEHDSFSSKRTIHREIMEYIIGKKRLSQSTKLEKDFLQTDKQHSLFSTAKWCSQTLPHIEHPHYTRPEIWHNQSVPSVLLQGNHRAIDTWRKQWSKSTQL